MTTDSGMPPGYVAGVWRIDVVHSHVGFSVRHLMVSNVRGQFSVFTGTITTAEDPLASSVVAEIETASFTTGSQMRDDHVRSPEFLDVANYPTMTYRSSSVTRAGDGYVINGDLTLRGTTRPVALSGEMLGFGPDDHGGMRCGFSATTTIDRGEFGVRGNKMLDGGIATIGERVRVTLDVEAVLETGR